MAFTLEDGTGVAGSNSYASVEEANVYFADRLNTAWKGTESAKQAALIAATDYIELRYARRFIGVMVDVSQSLSWPRTGTIYASDAIPEKLKRATFEYAVRALSAELAPDPSRDESGVTLVATKKKLGPLEKEFQIVGSRDQFRGYPAADSQLSNLVTSSSRVIR